MIKLEKLEKGEFFEDAFLVSYRYNKDYLNKMRSLKYKRYVPDKKAWEIPSSELKHLVDLFGVDDINVNAKYLEGLVEKEESKAEETPEDIKERLKDIKPIVDYPFKTKPFPHQIEAFNKGYECKNLLLADDQGLGKTKESIDIAVARKGEIGKCLIVCGVNSVKYNWKKEVSVAIVIPQCQRLLLRLEPWILSAVLSVELKNTLNSLRKPGSGLKMEPLPRRKVIS